MTVPADEQRLREIEREHRHANATRRTETDSWLNGYMDDVGFLLALLRVREQEAGEAKRRIHDLLKTPWLLAPPWRRPNER